MIHHETCDLSFITNYAIFTKMGILVGLRVGLMTLNDLFNGDGSLNLNQPFTQWNFREDLQCYRKRQLLVLLYS